MRKVGDFYGDNVIDLDYFCFFAKTKTTKNEQIHKGHSSYNANRCINHCCGLQ